MRWQARARRQRLIGQVKTGMDSISDVLAASATINSRPRRSLRSLPGLSWACCGIAVLFGSGARQGRHAAGFTRGLILHCWRQPEGGSSDGVLENTSIE
jgi:hypothetical protein